MSTLPPSADYTGASVTQGGKKTFMAAVRLWLSEAFGTDSTPATVLAALGGLAKAGGVMTGLLTLAKGANIASASTVNLSTATGNTVTITGTTGISAWTMTSGQVMDVIFAAALILTHHATNNNLPGGVNITTAAGDRARIYYDGTTVYVTFAKASGAPVTPEAYIHIRDEKASSTQGGTSIATTWQTRVLNTESVDTGGNATLASNQITLAAGTYRVRARAPASLSSIHKIRLRNVTSGVTLLVGSSAYNSPVSGIQTDSVLTGRITVAAAQVLELQHWVNTARGTDGLGTATISGEVEVYAEVEFWKEA